MQESSLWRHPIVGTLSDMPVNMSHSMNKRDLADVIQVANKLLN
jgi:hypothetical protein